jgi:hypothetical protein
MQVEATYLYLPALKIARCAVACVSTTPLLRGLHPTP